jgi:hypothetical protein
MANLVTGVTFAYVLRQSLEWPAQVPRVFVIVCDIPSARGRNWR